MKTKNPETKKEEAINVGIFIFTLIDPECCSENGAVW